MKKITKRKNEARKHGKIDRYCLCKLTKSIDLTDRLPLWVVFHSKIKS